jgi:hypothetical protein
MIYFLDMLALSKNDRRKSFAQHVKYLAYEPSSSHCAVS